jgi:type IV secretion system protein VirB1
VNTLLAISLLLLPSAVRAQIPAESTLESICVPTAPVTTLRAVVQVESSGNPNAMQIDFPKALLKRWNLPAGTLRLNRQPTDQREALNWLAYFQSYDIFVDLGLMQVSTAEAKRRGISPESLLEPCTNLRVGWQILEDDYRIEQQIYGPGQEALRRAISRYNTGDAQRGIANGYLGRVLAAVQSLQALQ